MLRRGFISLKIKYKYKNKATDALSTRNKNEIVRYCYFANRHRHHPNIHTYSINCVDTSPRINTANVT